MPCTDSTILRLRGGGRTGKPKDSEDYSASHHNTGNNENNRRNATSNVSSTPSSQDDSVPSSS
eukprot:14087999-Ditylum_brightwellii.AAC.1